MRAFGTKLQSSLKMIRFGWASGAGPLLIEPYHVLTSCMQKSHMQVPQACGLCGPYTYCTLNEPYPGHQKTMAITLRNAFVIHCNTLGTLATTLQHLQQCEEGGASAFVDWCNISMVTVSLAPCQPLKLLLPPMPAITHTRLV